MNAARQGLERVVGMAVAMVISQSVARRASTTAEQTGRRSRPSETGVSL